MGSRKRHSKGCYRYRRDLHHSAILLKTFWGTGTPGSHSPSEELPSSQQWGRLVSSMSQSKFICTANILNVINHFKVAIHQLIFNTPIPKFLFLQCIKVHHNQLSICLLCFCFFHFIPTLMRYLPSFIPNKRTVSLVASSTSVQTPLPGHKLIHFEKEQGECLSLFSEKNPLFTGEQITFQQSGEWGYLSPHNQHLHPKTINPNPKLCFLCILPLWTSWLITLFLITWLFSHTCHPSRNIIANIVPPSHCFLLWL